MIPAKFLKINFRLFSLKVSIFLCTLSTFSYTPFLYFYSLYAFILPYSFIFSFILFVRSALLHTLFFMVFVLTVLILFYSYVLMKTPLGESNTQATPSFSGCSSIQFLIHFLPLTQSVRQPL